MLDVCIMLSIALLLHYIVICRMLGTHSYLMHHTISCSMFPSHNWQCNGKVQQEMVWYECKTKDRVMQPYKNDKMSCTFNSDIWQCDINVQQMAVWWDCTANDNVGTYLRQMAAWCVLSSYRYMFVLNLICCTFASHFYLSYVHMIPIHFVHSHHLVTLREFESQCHILKSVWHSYLMYICTYFPAVSCCCIALMC